MQYLSLQPIRWSGSGALLRVAAPAPAAVQHHRVAGRLHHTAGGHGNGWHGDDCGAARHIYIQEEAGRASLKRVQEGE